MSKVPALELNPEQTNSSKRALPDNWRRVQLGDVCEFVYGRGLPFHQRRNGKFPVYGSNGIVGFHDEPVTKGASIIIGRKGSVGEIHYSPVACYPIDTTYYVEETKIEADLVWLSYWLKALKLSELNQAAAIPGLNRDDVYSLEIPLPPFEEQNRIVAILNEQLATIGKAHEAAEEQLHLSSRLINALLRETMQGDGVKKEKLNNCAVEVKQGIGSRWSDYPLFGATRLGLASAKEGVGKNPDRYKFVDAGTIFYNPMRILIGSIAMIDDEDEPGITSPDYVVFKPLHGNLHFRWFYYWLRSPYGEAFIKRLARGAVRERMLFKRIEDAEIDLPGWEIQLKAAEKLKVIANLQKKIRDQLDTINKIPVALLRRAFNGEL